MASGKAGPGDQAARAAGGSAGPALVAEIVGTPRSAGAQADNCSKLIGTPIGAVNKGAASAATRAQAAGTAIAPAMAPRARAVRCGDRIMVAN